MNPDEATAREVEWMHAHGENGTVTVDQEWLSIERDGWSCLGHSEANKRIRLDAITNVQMRPPRVFGEGYIAFETADHRFRGSVEDARRDDHAVIFSRQHKSEFEQLRTSIGGTPESA